MPTTETFIAVVLGAILYSVFFFLSKRTKEGGEPFAPRKMARSIIVGAIVGVFAAASGIEVSPTNFEQLMAASGAVALADQIWKALIRWAREFNRSLNDSTR